MREFLDKIWEWAGYLLIRLMAVSFVSFVFEDQFEALFAADPIQVKKNLLPEFAIVRTEITTSEPRY